MQDACCPWQWALCTSGRACCNRCRSCHCCNTVPPGIGNLVRPLLLASSKASAGPKLLCCNWAPGPARRYCPVTADPMVAWPDAQSTCRLTEWLMAWMNSHTAQAHVPRASLLLLMQDQQYKVGCSLVRQSQADLVEDDAQPPPAIARQRQPPQTQVLAC